MSIHLRKITVSGIGPLHQFELEPHQLTVVVGDNESGKSSIVTALHRGLRQTFKRANATSLDGVRRNVDGFDGHVILEFEPANGTGEASAPELLARFPILWNLLVIPEGYAAVTSVGANSNWLQESSEHLTGFDPDPFFSSIRSTAGLTPTNRDTRDWSVRGTELVARIRELDEFLASLEGLADQEAALRRAQHALSELEAEAARERTAVGFERYERARRALDSVRRVEHELGEYGRVSTDELSSWRGLESRAQKIAASLEEARTAAEDAEGELKEAQREVERARRELTGAEDAASRIVASGLADRANRLSAKMSVDAERASRWRRLRPLAWGLSLVGVVTVLIGVAMNRWDLSGLGGLLVFVGIGMVVMEGRWAAIVRAGGREGAQLVEDARSLELEADDVEGVIAAIREEVRAAEGLQSQVSNAEQRQERRGVRVEQQQQRVAGRENDLSEIKAAINAVRDRTGLAELGLLEAHVHQRSELELEKSRAESTLEELLGSSDGWAWQEQVEAMAVPDPGRTPTAGLLDDIERKRSAQESCLGQLREATFGTMDRGLARIRSGGLDEVRAEFEALGHERKQRSVIRRSAQLALDAVSEVHNDLEEQLNEVLEDPESGASALFSKITGDRWDGCQRTEDGDLLAVAGDGQVVGISGLSRGTQDQLVFAIRAVLAERILSGPAFFVWDDTFLTADPQRRGILVRASVDLVLRGWQIIYLTLDPSIADLFEKAATDAALEDFCRISLGRDGQVTKR